jgi:2-phosphosulfolactate phosphatase
MKSIDVCLSPDLMHLYAPESRTVVVVDVLRATSTIVTALAHGAAGILPVPSLEVCRQKAAEGFLIAGERDGRKVEGFDKGNSPFDFMGADVAGKKIAFTTTNGTQAIEKSKHAREIIIGSFLNLSSLTDYLLRTENSVLIVCAGWKGRINLEDTLFAGAVVEKLKEFLGPDCDAPLAAQHLYNLAKPDLKGFLSQSSHVKRLNQLNIHRDFEFCLTADRYNITPRVQNGWIVA